MKKVLATVAALGLIVGVSANALALDKPGKGAEVESTTAPRVAQATAPGVALWSVAGQWSLAGAYLSKGQGPGHAAVSGQSDSNDAFYLYSFKVLPVLKVNDKISVKGEYRVTDRGVLGFNDLSQTSAAKWYTVYMEYVSPYGKTRFGRTPAGAWGSSKFNNSTRQGQRLMWWLNMLPENFGSLIFTEKLNEQDAASGANISDQDRDAYYVDLSFKADIGKTVGALWIVRDARGGQDALTSYNIWLNGKYTFGDIGLEWEGDFGLGDASATTDKKSIALMADLSFKSGDWKFGALGIYGSGDNDATDGDSEAAFATSKGTGRDYNPYQIMMGDYMNMWNADNPLTGNTINTDLITAGGNAGLWSIGGYLGYKVSPKMSASAEIGYFAATDEPAGYDSEYGIEVGFGMSYKLYDNLTYGAHFSYLFTGDYFNLANTASTEDIYLLAHALSMKF